MTETRLKNISSLYELLVKENKEAIRTANGIVSKNWILINENNSFFIYKMKKGKSELKLNTFSEYNACEVFYKFISRKENK